MLMLHANWTEGALRLWAESLDAYRALAAGHSYQTQPQDRSPAPAPAPGREQISTAIHPFAVDGAELRERLNGHGFNGNGSANGNATIPLRLPAGPRGPLPSDRLAGAIGSGQQAVDPWLAVFSVPCATIPNDRALAVMLSLETRGPAGGIEFAHSLRFWMTVSRFVLELLEDQRFLPTLMQARGEKLKAAWQPWLHDESTRTRVGALMTAMPPVARAAIDRLEGHPWRIIDEALGVLTDSTVREALIDDTFADALDGRDVAEDPHVAWLSGLLDRQREVDATSSPASSMLRDVALWVGRLDETGRDRSLQLCLRLHEPAESLLLEDLRPISDEVHWRLSLHLRFAQEPRDIIDAEELWARSSAGRFAGRMEDQPQELLLKELTRASRIYPRVEEALAETTPTGVDLTTAEAYEFLREYRPVLEEAGFEVIAPRWWGDPAARLGARLQVDSSDGEAGPIRHAGGRGAGGTLLGLNSFVEYRWQIAVGDQPLTIDEFRSLARQKAALVRVRGRWVEIRPEQMAAATDFLAERPGGQMRLMEALRLAHGADGKDFGLPVLGMDATGWVGDLLSAAGPNQRVPVIDQPKGFVGQLRPYQKTGLSWMAFLENLGLGACLADDMGLGKTIQLIALMLHEREQALTGQSIGPTLLIVPTSLIGNWMRELKHFAPNLTGHVQHGPERPTGEHFESMARQADLVITTYALVSRDRDTLGRLQWHRVALDEAQYIKNPPTKQTSAIRALKAERRLTLTGTPVENRLSELWSIMEFCNPGYLGPAGTFRRRFAVPIERHRDQRQADRLRGLVQPFILRRVKTDPTVIDDLPECVSTKEFATLTTEQAALYKRTVETMLSEVDRSGGMQRRGRVLAALVRLKQICNHPSQAGDLAAPKDGDVKQAREEKAKLGNGPIDPEIESIPALSRRSGKAMRLLTMLEEIFAAGEKALVFTQFRRMGHLLAAMVQYDLDTEAIFMHGGTPQAKRQQMIDKFQSGEGASVFILSLKAGGVGLNLTAANHVFHYDRWWNPAVENQATDRAFRIGQTRTVHVHKFVCVGTLEERIDQMIEQKTELAEKIIGVGERWLTELSTGQLRDLLVLRDEAMEGEG